MKAVSNKPRKAAESWTFKLFLANLLQQRFGYTNFISPPLPVKLIRIDLPYDF